MLVSDNAYPRCYGGEWARDGEHCFYMVAEPGARPLYKFYTPQRQPFQVAYTFKNERELKSATDMQLLSNVSPRTIKAMLEYYHSLAAEDRKEVPC